MGVKIKHTDPTLNSFSTDDLVVNVSEGSLFFKSNTELFRIKGDTLTTTVTESFGDELWHRTGNNLYYTSGSVGIGTASPSNQLHIFNTGNAEAVLERDSGAKILLQAQASAGVVGTNSNHDLDIKSNGSTRIKVENTGNVGIGTTSPGEKLHLSGSSNTLIEVETSTDTTEAGIIFNTARTGAGMGSSKIYKLNSTTYIETDEGLDFKANNRRHILASNGSTRFYSGSAAGGTDSTEYARFDHVNKRLGIGTASPGEKLTVAGNISGSENLYLSSGSSNIGGTVVAPQGILAKSGSGFEEFHPIWGVSHQYPATSNGIAYYEGSPDAIVFSGVRIGIHTTTPALQLVVSGANSDANSGVFQVVTPGSNVRIGGDDTYSWIQSHASQPLSINPLGLTGNNPVGIGTTTPTGSFDVLMTTSAGNRFFRTHQAGQNTPNNYSNGVRMSRRGDTSGWAFEYGFESNNLERDWGGFGGHGSGNSDFTKWYIGQKYDNAVVEVHSGSAHSTGNDHMLINGSLALRKKDENDIPTHWLHAAASGSNDNANIGCIVIDNIPDENTMLHITIRGYEYEGGHGAWTIILGCYWYHPNNNWYNTSAQVYGACPIDRVRWAKTSDTTPTIILGTTTTGLNYPQVAIDILKGYNHQEDTPQWHIKYQVTDISAHTILRQRFFPTFLGQGAAANAAGNASGQDENAFTIRGALSKGSGTFKIDHPDPLKTDTHYLQHSFVESPTGGDNIYRWTVTTTNKIHTITLPDYYKFLNKDDMVWISPVNHFGRAYGTVNQEQTEINIVTDTDGIYNVLLVGTRKDPTVLRQFEGVEIKK